MSEDIPFGEIEIGETLGPVSIPSDAESIGAYCNEHRYHDPIYLEDSPFGGPVVPPLLYTTLVSLRLLGTKWDTHATVPGKTEQENINPAWNASRLNPIEALRSE